MLEPSNPPTLPSSHVSTRHRADQREHGEGVQSAWGSQHCLSSRRCFSPSSGCPLWPGQARSVSQSLVFSHVLFLCTHGPGRLRCTPVVSRKCCQGPIRTPRHSPSSQVPKGFCCKAHLTLHLRNMLEQCNGSTGNAGDSP